MKSQYSPFMSDFGIFLKYSLLYAALHVCLELLTIAFQSFLPSDFDWIIYIGWIVLIHFYYRWCIKKVVKEVKLDVWAMICAIVSLFLVGYIVGTMAIFIGNKLLGENVDFMVFYVGIAIHSFFCLLASYDISKKIKKYSFEEQQDIQENDDSTEGIF